METALISKSAVIGKNVRIGHGAIIHDNVFLGEGTFIGPYCIIGEPKSNYYKDDANHEFQKTIIGKNCIIRSFTTVYEEVEIGDEFQSGHHAVIREGSRIGHHTSFGSFSELPGPATIGNYVRIHSKVMLSERNNIEDFVWIFPFVVLTNVKHPPMGDFEVTTIKKYAQLFSHAIILPGITIGENAIIGAGALVTEDVGNERLIIGNPAKDVKSVREIRDEKGNFVYPWKDSLQTYRGYPWQIK